MGNLLNKGLLFRCCKELHNVWIRILWIDQRKTFKSIGKGGSVLELPYVNGAKYIEIGNNFYCGKDVRLEAWEKYGNQHFTPQIIIGDNVIFTDRCYLSCIDRIEIGDGVLLGRDVFIADNSHGDSTCKMIRLSPAERPLTSKGAVVIGKNVWIGRQVTVLSGVTIGENSIIGANSVVNKDIPPNCVAAGNPAKIVKYLEGT